MSPPGAGRRSLPDLLVVDDDEYSRRVVEGFLKQQGYRVRFAASGSEALEMVRARTPDLVFLDIMMPDMTGLEVCQAIKNNPTTRTTQVMMVTALDTTADFVAGLDTGADDYVSKPVQREEFLAKVRSLLRARELLVELEAARAELEERNRELELKKTLAQTLVHDLKSPLTAVIGAMDVLAAGAPDDKRRTLLERAQGAAVRMNRMILDLLDVEGIEQAGLGRAFTEVDLRALARQAVEESSVHAERSGVTVSMVATDEGCLVDGVASYLRRVIDNLVANAIAHSRVGQHVTVSVGRRPEGIECSVADQGDGVPAEHRERIFDKYARLELRDAGITMNRGLGLTFCRLAVESHGGAIWVDDAPGGGAWFRVLLPASLGIDASGHPSMRETGDLPAASVAVADAREG